MARRKLKLEVYLKELSWGYAEHKHATMAAAMAFRGLFSAIPFIALFAAAYEWVQNWWQLNEIPVNIKVLDLSFMTQAVTAETVSWLQFKDQPIIWLTGVVLLIYGASAVFRELTIAMELIWEKQNQSKAKQELIRKLLAVSLVFVMAGILLLAIFGNWFLDAISQLLAESGMTAGLVLMEISRSLLPVLTFALLLVIYKYLPRVKLQWKQVWLGALLATVMFWIGQMVMGWFLGRTDLTSAYGAAGSVVMFLLWSYYTGLIVLLGAEWVRVQVKLGGKIQPLRSK